MEAFEELGIGDLNFLILNNENDDAPEEYNNIMDLFKEINAKVLSLKHNSFYYKVFTETKNIYSFLNNSINNFHLLFDKDLKNLEDCIKYLSEHEIPNKCVCAGVINNIPGWRCIECSKYDSAIYCTNCYKKSKHLHKEHKIYFLGNSNGMCDCGDPDSLYTFCPDHSGPYSDQKKIDEYISNTFENKILVNLHSFFDTLFLQLSKYFILTEKCEFFCEESFDEYFEKKATDNIANDIKAIKKDFCIVFQNLIHFLRLISQKNLGMLHLIAKYFLKNHFYNQKIDKKYYTTHRCIQISQNDIKFYNSENKKHICICPFFRLFMTNYRDNIKLSKYNKDFLISFAHNIPLRSAYSILYFSQYKQIIMNNNNDIISNRSQFILEDAVELIAEKTNLLEEAFDTLYQHILKNIETKHLINTSGKVNERLISKLIYPIVYMKNDTEYFSKPNIRTIMTNKTSILKRTIDILCLIHNQNEFKSIVPHPQYQEKGFSSDLIDLECKIMNIVEEIILSFDWEKIDQLNDIFKYLINKILNQEKENIKQLSNNEYSFHLALYRCFGLLINSFCLNYCFNNEKTLIDAIQFFKNKFFESPKQLEKFIEILLKDYTKLFGFIAGTKNNYFNYYDNLNYYSNEYFLENYAHLIDFSLLKYLFVMYEKEINIISFLEMSNIENVYNQFEESFIKDKKTVKKDDNKDKKTIQKEELNNTNNNNNSNNNNNNNNDNLNDIQIFQLLRNGLQGEMDRNQIRRILNNINNIENESNNEDKSKDEYNCIMQWRLLFEIIIDFMKDDSCIFWALMRNYTKTVFPKTKRDLFNKIRKNKYAMDDLENILKEKLIHEIIALGNLIDLKKITKNLDEYLQALFEDNNKLNEILDEITYNKVNGEEKLFYLKDSYLKYLDMNNYFSFQEKSGAQRYILEFKKDIIKSYNYYYYNPSELTFEFFEKVYEKILLNKKNLELIMKIVDKLINKKIITNNLDIKSVINTLLPIILNYLSMFSVINTQSFIKFKIANKDLINKLCEILSKSVNDKENDILEKDLKDNIKDVIDQLNKYQIIIENINNDYSKLNKYNYNTEFSGTLNENEGTSTTNKNAININSEDNNKKINDKNKKSNNLKNKFKNLMKKKANLFLDKVSSKQEILQEINEQNKIEENKKDSNDEIMCFYCRNTINLNSLKVSYGKLGKSIEDYFYDNSLKATIRTELAKLTNNDIDKDNIYNKIIENFTSEKFNRIISCGHYFHTTCFLEGCQKEIDQFDEFSCPLCLKKQNILIPPLNRFHDKSLFLKSENIDELFDEKIKMKKIEWDKELDLLNDIIYIFLSSNNFMIKEYKDYSSFLYDLYPQYKSHFNFLENIFYINGVTFHKHQLIDTLQNINLSLRFLIRANNSNFNQIIEYIKNELTYLARGPLDNEYIYNHQDMHMRYVNLLEKILLSLSILFNYDEIEDTFKYIIYIFLPYFIFGFYFRDLIIKKELNIIEKLNIKEKMNFDDLEQYVNNNNKQLLNYFKTFLKKFALFKLISDFTYKNEHIINSFNELNLENLLSLLDKDNLYKLIPKNENNEINLINIFNCLKKIFNPNEIFYKIFDNILDYKRVFNFLFVNIIKNYNEKSSIDKELIIQFSPVKFEFTYMDNNIFDWIERNLEKNCEICNKLTKYSFICLICGKKVCHSKYSNYHISTHTKNCAGEYGLFVDMDNMKLVLWNSYNTKKKLFPIYVNKTGNGPEGYEIGNEFNLSHEKLNLAIKNYACYDFNFN